jgi:hypothetical protein
LIINVLNKSLCTIGSTNLIDSCKINLSNNSYFTVELPIEYETISMKSVDINVRKNSHLDLVQAQIEQLKLNTQDNNSIKLSSETLMNLMKK